MGSVGTTKNTVSNTIKNEFMRHGLTSRLKGVKRDAEAGTGNYSFKDAIAVDSKEAGNMNDIKFFERDGKTLAHGFIGERHVFYAANSSDNTIKTLKENVSNKRDTHVVERPEITPTSTYDRWKKRNDKRLEAWFGKERLK